MILRYHESQRLRVAAMLTLAGLLLGPILACAQEGGPSPAEVVTGSKTPEEVQADLRTLVQRFDRVLADMDEDIAALREQTAFGGGANLVELLERMEAMRANLAAQRDEVIQILERPGVGPAQ